MQHSNNIYSFFTRSIENDISLDRKTSQFRSKVIPQGPNFGETRDPDADVLDVFHKIWRSRWVVLCDMIKNPVKSFRADGEK